MAPNLISRITFLVVLFVSDGFPKNTMFTAAVGFFRQQISRGTRSQHRISYFEEKPTCEGCFLTPSERENLHTPMTAKAREDYDPKPMAIRNSNTIILSRTKSSVKEFPQERKTTAYSFADNLGRSQVSKNFQSFRCRQDVIAATRLSGGAEQESTIPEMSDKASETNDGRKLTGAFLGSADYVRKRSLDLSKTMAQRSGPIIDKVKSTADLVQKTSSRVAPSFLTTVSLLCTSNKGMSALTLYALALLGASCGFHLFLHFITIGYALGIGLPLSVALYVCNKHSRLPRATVFHSVITLVWSVRMLAFFIWREYVSWPALHEKVVEIQKRMKIPFASRMLCWLVYSFFYLSMMSMTWSRLQQGMNSNWGLLGYMGLLMQVGGLGLETIADLQKNGFKSRNRHAWCNVGVWKWSSHPNYLGEGLFWWGSYLSHGFSSIPRIILSTVGLGFIMSVLKGSTRSLSIKHMEKYGDQPEFFEFQRTHSIWGPKQFWWWIHGMEHLSDPTTVIDSTTTAADCSGNSTNTTNTSPLEETPSLPSNV